MGEMRVLTEKGDIVIEWDPHTPESVKGAKEQWKQLKADGYEFFEALPGEKGKRLTRFKADLARVLVVPGVKTKQDRKKGVVAPGRRRGAVHAPAREKAMAGGPNELAADVPLSRMRQPLR